MITVKSNIDKFLEYYKKKVSKFTSLLYTMAEKLANKMILFMKDEINRKHSTWYELGSYNDINNVDFEILNINEYSIRIDIGKNLPKFEMSDGTLVNPAFFIEFGFGLVGQSNPQEKHEEFDWGYNINGHTKGWVYFGRDGKFHGSKGRAGINFMYNAQQKAKEFLKEIMTEIKNG